jgi:anthranilate phosphoribosyltransferase
MEAETAMKMIMAGNILPEQLGAFLMLLRFKEETPEEISGFVRAARSSLNTNKGRQQIDIDWSSYAGKTKQLPWYLLSVLLLSKSGIKILMHGSQGHTAGRIYTAEAMKILGLPIATSLEEADKQIGKFNFSFISLKNISPRLQEIMDLKTILGLRSPIHTIARLLNPFNAPCVLQGIFHRSFMKTHQRAAQLLNHSKMTVFRGEGGEIEIRPNKPTELFSINDSELEQQIWPAMLDQSHQQIDEDLDLNRLKKIWDGTSYDEYAVAAIIGTTAVALKTLGKSDERLEAISMASSIWDQRDINYFKN